MIRDLSSRLMTAIILLYAIIVHLSFAFCSNYAFSGAKRPVSFVHGSFSRHISEGVVASCTSEHNETIVDLSSPRLWLESEPNGVYTVMRCDYCFGRSEWVKWGEDFHRNRLLESIQMLENDSEVKLSPESLEQASHETENAVSTLLRETQARLSENLDGCLDDNHISTTMVTILWHLSETDSSKVFVKGHVYADLRSTGAHNYNPEPATVVLALESDEAHKVLPSRQQLPRAKRSSWCSDRRPLEDQFKGEGVSEVILVDTSGGIVSPLEGLTSNIVFLYHNGELRSAKDGVLEGCARRLLFDSAKRLGFRPSLVSVSLAESHLWKSVFLTSSIRLLIPVKRICVLKEGVLIDVWVDEEIETDGTPAWKMLHKDMIDNMLGIQMISGEKR